MLQKYSDNLMPRVGGDVMKASNEVTKFSDLTLKQQRTIRAGLWGILFFMYGAGGLVCGFRGDLGFMVILIAISVIGLKQVAKYRDRHRLMDPD